MNYIVWDTRIQINTRNPDKPMQQGNLTIKNMWTQ